MVLDVGMALVGYAANQVPVRVAAAGGIERAKGHPVVQRHMHADGGGFPDDHASAVINEKGLVEFGAGMNINPGAAVSNLSHHSRQIRHLEKIQFVSQPLHRYRFHSGIAQQYLFVAARGRVVFHRGAQVRAQQLGKPWQFCV